MNLFSLGGFFSDIWMSIWLSLNNFVYSIIGMLYQVFECVANVNLFSEEVFKDITSRIYIIMGIAMLFIFAYNLILMIINPEEKKSTGQTTKVVKETIISLVLVILLPTIFNYMSIFQRHVLESGILSQIILGDTGGTSVEDCEKYKNYTIINDKTNIGDRQWNFEWYDWIANGAALLTAQYWFVAGSAGAHLVDYLIQTPTLPTDYLYNSCLYSKSKSPSTRGAYSLPATIFSAFYHPTDYGFYECAEFIENGDKSVINTSEEEEMCSYYYYDVKMSVFNGNIKYFNDESEFYSRVKADDGTFEFNGLMALAAGVLALYMFVCYTMAIGVRVAKLGFLQIISPIAVMMRIIPKQKEAMFDKWLKELINTYLDVFIRLIIIYFCLFAVSLVPDVIKTLFSSIDGSLYAAMLATVVVILGILMFAQQAPDLFKQFFGGGNGNFSLKSPKKQFNENKLAKGAVGYVSGAALGVGSGLAKGKPLAAIGGLFRGGKNGAKNMYGADLTKKGAFTDTMKNSKYQTDYEQNHTKFKAIRAGIDKEGGVGKYLKKQGTDFIDFLGDANNQSEKYGAANKLFTDSAIVNDLIINGIIKDEGAAKDNWAKGESIDLGDNYYRRDKDRGVWIGPDGKEYNKSQMKDKMDEYYKNKKITEMASKLAKDDKGQRAAFKQWSEDFNKTMMDNFPKLGDEISKRFFDTISKEGGIEISNMNDLMSKMEELQKKGADGDKLAYEQLSTIKVAMDKGFKDMKDGSYDMNPQKK